MSDTSIDDESQAQVKPAVKTCEPKPTSDADDVPLPGIRAWLGALKVVSLLAAVGFIAKLAHEQMLGIQLTDWSALDLSLFAGRWIVDTLTTLLESLSAAHYHPLFWIILALLPALTMIFLQQYPRVVRISRFVGVGAAAIALSFVILHFELPTLALSNWLTSDLPSLANPVGAGKLGSREELVRYVYFMSKTDVADQAKLDQMHQAISDAAMHPGGTDAAQSFAAINDPLAQEATKLFAPLLLNHAYTATDAQDEMNTWYSASFWICGIALLTCFVFVVKGGRDLEDEILSALYYFTALVLLPVACALLPYMYGKLIYLSEFPQATIVTFPQETGGKDKSPSDDHDGILIGQADKDYTLLSVNNGAMLTHVYSEATVKDLSMTPGPNDDMVEPVLDAKASAAVSNIVNGKSDSGSQSQNRGGSSK